jgi:hypothetical protein
MADRELKAGLLLKSKTNSFSTLKENERNPIDEQCPLIRPPMISYVLSYT